VTPTFDCEDEMDLGLHDKVAMVAASSSGLGLAIARELAREGAHVALCARDPDRLAEAAAAVDGAGAGRVLATPVDVRQENRVRGWVDEVTRELGPVGIVVANAGGPPAGTASEHGVAAYRDAVELNLLSAIALTQAALPGMRERGWGRILFVTSQSVKQPIPHLALSNTARAGVLGYAKSLVHELGDAGITVNVLAPGSHRTPRLEELAGEDVEAGLAAMATDIPLGRVGRPEEFAAAAAFLASERASYVTGVVLPVDGGSIRSLS
jgi:3-oxoacyl-[acyl-carrier protein] reductase